MLLYIMWIKFVSKQCQLSDVLIVRNILCAICEAQDITKYADHWCPECDEGLCSDCQNHHNISKSSRSHCVISIENYHQLPSSISEIGNHCKYHDMKYSFLISVKFCSMLSINVDVLDVLIISRIDVNPTQSLWFVEMQSGQQGLSWNWKYCF
jgi:hypothetical protein